jgi:hypothetical protein
MVFRRITEEDPEINPFSTGSFKDRSPWLQQEVDNHEDNEIALFHRIRIKTGSQPLASDSEAEEPVMTRNGINRQKNRPSQGDAVLVSFMDRGKRPEIVREAGAQPLASDSEEEEPVMTRNGFNRQKNRLSQGDAVLASFLDRGK